MEGWSLWELLPPREREGGREGSVTMQTDRGATKPCGNQCVVWIIQTNRDAASEETLLLNLRASQTEFDSAPLSQGGGRNLKLD